MRGKADPQVSMLSLATPEQRVPKGHPLRRIKMLADAALAELSTLFDEMYAESGRASIPPERLLKASLLMAFYTVRSERLFCEQLDYNLLFRWFLDMDMVEPSFDHSTFSKNRQRLIEHDVAKEFFARVVERAKKARLMSSEHFTVDGTLIDAWASLKSLRPRGERRGKRPPPDDPGNPSVDFHGKKRSNATHESSTDPESRLMRKGTGKEAKLSYAEHALMENRHGLLVDLRVTEADGTAERDAALDMLTDLPGGARITVGGDAGYDVRAFIQSCRDHKITPHIARNRSHPERSAVDRRTLRHAGYDVSQKIRKRIEEVWGWMKTVGNFRRTRFRGRKRTELAAYLVGAAYNLLRMARLLETPT